MRLHDAMLCINQDQFWERVNVSDPDACWNWRGLGRRGAKGVYGAVHVRLRKGKYWTDSAHRIAWSLANQRLPKLQVLHHCDNGLCCNPAHLYEGTQKQNSHDTFNRARTSRAKVTISQVREIRSQFPQFTQTSIARSYGLHSSQVSRIVRGVSFSWVTDDET